MVILWKVNKEAFFTTNGIKDDFENDGLIIHVIQKYLDKINVTIKHIANIDYVFYVPMCLDTSLIVFLILSNYLSKNTYHRVKYLFLSNK